MNRLGWRGCLGELNSVRLPIERAGEQEVASEDDVDAASETARGLVECFNIGAFADH